MCYQKHIDVTNHQNLSRVKGKGGFDNNVKFIKNAIKITDYNHLLSCEIVYSKRTKSKRILLKMMEIGQELELEKRTYIDN